MTVESYLNKIEKSITSGTIEENYEIINFQSTLLTLYRKIYGAIFQKIL